MAAVVQLFIMKNGALEGTELVSSERFVIGSDPASAVQLDDPSVGARHVGVFVHDGKLAIQDLGARGGTLINGAPISGARYVNAREDVVIGVYTVKLKLMPLASAQPSAVPSAAPAPAPMAPAPMAPLPVPSMVPSPSAPPVSMAAAHRSDDLEKTVPLSAGLMADSLPSVGDDTVVDKLTLSATQPSMGPSPALALAVGPSAEPTSATSAPLTLWIDDDEEHVDDEQPWSLVEHLVQQPEAAAGKHPIVEVVHYSGEHVVDHRVLQQGDTFVLGDVWTKAVRIERGLDKKIPLVRLKKDGIAELLGGASVSGKVLRQGVSQELGPGPAPLVDGELCSLKVGNERVFVRFAGVPALVWTAEQIVEARNERRLMTASSVLAVVFLIALITLQWLYGFRSKSQDVIELGDDGFAEVVVKDLQFEEPEKKKKPPPPIKTTEPVPTKQPEPKETPTAKTTPEPTPAEKAPEPPKPGLAAALQNIPKVSDSASNQNLDAALSNIKGVRVPGAQGGFKTSALTGKGPSSGVQIGGAAGGVATTGINSLIRKDGAAGALGGKGDRQVAGKVTTQPRLLQAKGQGELSKDEIQRVISSHVGEIQYCYEKQLRSNAGLAGRVQLEWVVSPSGAVTSVKLANSTLASTEATNCMMSKVKTWKFPKPRGNGSLTIVYPFVFNTI